MAKKNKKSKSSKGMDELRASAQRIWLAGLGALATAEEEGGKVFQKLVERGEAYEASGKAKVEEGTEKARSRVDDARETIEQTLGSLGSQIDERVGQALQGLGIPTRDEIAELTRRVENLNARLESMGEGGGEPSEKAAPKKAAPKKAAAKTKKSTGTKTSSSSSSDGGATS